MTITTGSEVRTAGGFTSEYTNDEINTEIDIVEAELYQRYNLPRRSSFSIDDDYTDFYVSRDKIYEIIRLQVSVETSTDPSGYLSIATGSTTWTHTPPNNYITLNSDFINTYDTKQVRVQYIPKVANLLATVVTTLNLLDPVTIIDGETEASPQVIQLREKAKRYRMLLKPRIPLLSSNFTEFDKYEYVSITQSDLR